MLSHVRTTDKRFLQNYPIPTLNRVKPRLYSFYCTFASLVWKSEVTQQSAQNGARSPLWSVGGIVAER